MKLSPEAKARLSQMSEADRSKLMASLERKSRKIKEQDLNNAYPATYDPALIKSRASIVSQEEAAALAGEVEARKRWASRAKARPNPEQMSEETSKRIDQQTTVLFEEDKEWSEAERQDQEWLDHLDGRSVSQWDDTPHDIYQYPTLDAYLSSFGDKEGEITVTRLPADKKQLLKLKARFDGTEEDEPEPERNTRKHDPKQWAISGKRVNDIDPLIYGSKEKDEWGDTRAWPTTPVREFSYEDQDDAELVSMFAEMEASMEGGATFEWDEAVALPPETFGVGDTVTLFDDLKRMNRTSALITAELLDPIGQK